MRRRRNPAEVPVDLLVFEGFRYRTDRTDRAWRAAFGEFLAAREVWAAAHEGTVLPQYEVKGSCPFDYSRFRKSSA